MTSNPDRDCSELIHTIKPVTDDRDPTVECKTMLPHVRNMAFGFLPLRGKNHDVRIVTFLSCGRRKKVQIGKIKYDIPNNVIVDTKQHVSMFEGELVHI